ncbi:MAG: phage virion morphogenesis protein [Sandaracinobacter sp.]
MEIRFTITKDELTAGINRALAASSDFSDPMRAIASMLENGVRERFEDGEDPQGKPWVPSQRAREQGGRTLVDTAALLSSIASASDAFSAVVGTNLVYAAIHQFGGQIRGRQSRSSQNVPKPRAMPARPFLGFGPYEVGEIETILGDHLRRAFGGRA